MYLMIVLFSALFLMRLFSPRELDDVHPSLHCPVEIARSDVLWVIPLFKNDSIADHLDWCSSMRALHKTLELHGVYHTYEEFAGNVSADAFAQAVVAFHTCFGLLPTRFKPPQLAYSRVNDGLLKQYSLIRHGFWHQLTHKVYHCEDTGTFPNWFIRLF